MPDIDSPSAKNVSAIIEESGAIGNGGSTGSSGGGEPALKTVHLSKRPRDELTLTSGKRGRGENGDLLNLSVQHMSSALTLSGQIANGNTIPTGNSASPPLLESPSKLNRASPAAEQSSSASPTGFAAFAGKNLTPKHASPRKLDVASTPEVTWGQAARRKPLPPPKALPSLSTTDPVFHAALLRLLHRRGGKTCPEALGWRWCGDAPARFDHWPCALHPDIMNLLAYISASEERVVLTGCDVKPKKQDSGTCDSSEGEDENPTLLPPPPPREPSPWRAATSPRFPRGRRDSWGAPPAAVAAATLLSSSPRVSTPSATPRTPHRVSASSVTPCSALRKPNGANTPASRARSGAKSRGVRFSTHDMSVVDTPDPIRGGSEEGMVSALGGLQSILSAAERVRIAAGLGVSTGPTSVSSAATAASAFARRFRGARVSLGLGEEGIDRQFEGYFDRFNSTSSDSNGDRCKHDADAGTVSGINEDGGNAVTSTNREPGEEENSMDVCQSRSNGCGTHDGIEDGTRLADRPEQSVASRGDSVVVVNGGGQSAAVRAQEAAALCLRAAEARRVKEDVAALLTILDEIACGEAAPAELIVDAGWGPEHSNATAFYARELAMLCGLEENGGTAGVAGAEAAAATATPGTAVAVRAEGEVGAARASHLRVRYLDVLSCLVRYNLKLLLNLCTCEASREESENGDNDDEDGQFLEDCVKTASSEEGPPTTEMPSFAAAAVQNTDKYDTSDTVPSSSGLTVVLPSHLTVAAAPPQRASNCSAEIESHQQDVPKQPCSCVTVVDGTGALEFNYEDVAALLTLALRRLRPYEPLAARLAAVAAAYEQEIESKEQNGMGENSDDSGGDDSDDDDAEQNVLDDRIWTAVQQYVAETRAAADAATAHASCYPSSATDGICPTAELFSQTRSGAASADTDADSVASPDGSGMSIERAQQRAGAVSASAADVPVCVSTSEPDEAASVTELTADEASDLLQYVACARFVAQLFAEPVVASSVAAGSWTQTENLAKQVLQLAEAESEAEAAHGQAGSTHAGIGALASLSDMLCLGALADVEGLGNRMAQQARFAPALETTLKAELRQAKRRGQGRQRRLKNRLQQQNQHSPGAVSSGITAFPMVRPCCCFTAYSIGGPI